MLASFEMTNASRFFYAFKNVVFDSFVTVRRRKFLFQTLNFTMRHSFKLDINVRQNAITETH